MRTKRKVHHEETQEHREFVVDGLGDRWIWCLHCGRVYKKDEIRWDSEEGLYMCAYEGCNGDALMDAWGYEEQREARGWPEVPEKGVVYQ